MSKISCQSVSEVFRTDPRGKLTLQLAKLVSQYLKDKNFEAKMDVRHTPETPPTKIGLDVGYFLTIEIY